MPPKPELVAQAGRLAREVLAPLAARYDREARNPVECWDALWKDGLLALAVPARHGGLGADMPTYVAVIRALAAGCASTAMTLHMHSVVQLFLAALGTEAQQRRYFGEVVERGHLFGSWGSEPAISLSRTFLMETVIRRDGDGWTVEGTKHFCTMALGAAHYMVWGALDGGTDMSRAVLQALVPAESAGISTDGRWDTLGMRATFSPSVTLDRVRVPGDAVLGSPGQAIAVGVVEAFALGYAAVYCGCADAALSFALGHARERVTRPENVAMALDPGVQRHVGELWSRLDAAGLVLADSAERWDAADVPTRGMLANRAKYAASEASLAVTSRVVQLVGGRGAYRDLPVERAFRDVRTSTLMPPSTDRMVEALGRSVLGLAGGMFTIGGSEAPPPAMAAPPATTAPGGTG